MILTFVGRAMRAVFGRGAGTPLGGGLGSALILLSQLGCSIADDPSEQTATRSDALVYANFAVEYPAGTEIDQTALVARSWLGVNDDARVIGANGAAAPVSNVVSGMLNVGVRAEVGDASSRGDVFLRVDSRVRGSVRAGAAVVTQGPYTVTGAELPGHAFSQNRLLTWIVAFNGGQAIQLEPLSDPNQINERELAPGDYGSVMLKSRTRLILQGGTYHFESLSTEPQSRIRLPSSAQVAVFIRGDVTFRAEIEFAGSPRDVLWGAASTGWITVESPLYGTLVAPRAHVNLATLTPPRTHRGMVMAETIELHQRTDFLFEPYRWLRALGRNAADCDRCLDDCDTAALAECPADPDCRAITHCVDQAPNDTACTAECRTSRASVATARHQACIRSCDAWCSEP